MSNDDPQTQTVQPEPPKPKKQPPEITGISEITYPCGCEAKDSEGNLSATCAKHLNFKPEKPVITNRHGQVFDPEVFASQSDGSPATDSQGKFILKQHHYAPPAQNFFGSR